MKMSAVLLAVLILMIRTKSCCTNCWMKKCLSSMWLAFFDEPILVAMLLLLDESVWIRMFIFFMFSASCNRLRMCSASVAPVLIAYSSASALLKAIVACVRLPKCIVDPVNLITKPVVDFLVVGQPAQSLSTNTPMFGVCRLISCFIPSIVFSLSNPSVLVTQGSSRIFSVATSSSSSLDTALIVSPFLVLTVTADTLILVVGGSEVSAGCCGAVCCSAVRCCFGAPPSTMSSETPLHW